MEMAFKGLLLEADPGLRKDRDLTDAHYWIQDPDEGKFEDAERYREGGYCPITMYQMLKNGRYRVAYKLGNGHHSTVWLAQDLQEGSKVALKILTADSSVNSSERDVLRIVTDTCASSPYVTELLDAFNITSANGNHQVLVMPTMRPIMTMRDMITSFPSVVKSLVEALDKIHSAGIIHGGEVKHIYSRIASLIQFQTSILKTLGVGLTSRICGIYFHPNSFHCLRWAIIVLATLCLVGNGETRNSPMKAKESRVFTYPLFLILVTVSKTMRCKHTVFTY